MDINVKVRLESPELMAAILALAEALPQVKLETNVPVKTFETKEVQPIEVKQDGKESQGPNKETVKENKQKQQTKIVTLEEVRGKLAELSRQGKQPEVKALISKYGASKLTDIEPACYEELLKEAEVL